MTKNQSQKDIRQPTHSCDPTSFDEMTLRFQFDILDFSHELWGWETLTKEQHIHFLKFVNSIEKLTWSEIKATAGGKSHGTNHHSLEIANFAKIAQKRLQELNLDRIAGDTLFSLRINNLTRVYGVREEEFFRPIWHDPFHDQPNKAAYPIS
ncbi:MAG: hypothetical protein H0W88_07715 [Parachlamydiaceae bacterium]|nr:hypothetical protein [Parachlamydiaceae bacterium]